MADRYWVGGSGNWNDTAHWSTSSGGAGGASVPTFSDDVYIDSYSHLGPEIVQNNTFDTSTWWRINGAGVSIADGVAHYVNATGIEGVYSPGDIFVSGRRYRLSLEIKNYSSGDINMNDGYYVSTVSPNANGVWTWERTMDNTGFWIMGSGPANLDVDNVYVREVQSLNINLDVSLNCRSLICVPDVSAQLTGSAYDAYIYGDLSINNKTIFSLTGGRDMGLYSQGLSSISIDTSAFSLDRLIFYSSNAYIFNNDLSAAITLYSQWQSCDIDFNDHNITCREIELVGANNVNLGNSKIIVTDPHFNLYLSESVSEGNSTIILNQGSGNNQINIDDTRFNNLILNGNLRCGFLDTYNEAWIKNLLITSGSEIQLTSKTSTEPGVQTFHIDNIIALGTSDSSITLRATTAGTPFHIITTEDSYARIRYCHITDASVSPTTIWRAVNSVNGGNNRGIIFTNQDYDYINYYWVNDGGSWNDSTHWSPISGGIPGAYTITSSDNLIFDLHSFSTDSCIYTHIDVSSFKSINMSTIDQSVYLYVENDLNCYGDFTLSPRLSLPYRPYRSFNFYGQGDTYINTYGIPLMTNYVRLYNGNYILLSDLIQGNSSGTLYNTSQLLIDSSLDMNNFNVKTWSVNYDLTPGGTLYMRSGMLTAHNINFYRLHVIPGTSTIKLINELTSSSDRGEAFGDIWNNPKRYNRIWFSGTPGTGYPYTVDLTAQDGSLYANEIKIDPGINVTFDENSIINVRKFIAHGTKDGSIQVFSDTPGSKFTLNCTGDYDVQADYLYVRDCSAIPLNAWSAGNHGVDLGNNTGWKFRHHRDIPPLYYKSNLLDKFRYEDVWGYGVREP